MGFIGNLKKTCGYGATAYLMLYYSLMIKMMPEKRIHTHLGVRDAEALDVVSADDIKTALRIGERVKTLSCMFGWTNKCLCEAMAVRKLLELQKISCTLYLGVGKSGGRMVAHSWVRVGDTFIIGGDGSGYAVVGRFGTNNKA